MIGLGSTVAAAAGDRGLTAAPKLRRSGPQLRTRLCARAAASGRRPKLPWGALLFGILLLAASAFAAGANERAHRALILYDGTALGLHEGEADGLHVANLLGHFGYHAALQPLEEYRPGSMAHYEAVFVVGGSEKTKWPAALLSDARARTSLLVWLGYGADKFLSHGEDRKLGLRLNGVLQSNRFNQVRYRGYLLGKDSRQFTYMTVTNSARVSVPAVAVDQDGGEAPYILHTGNFWIVADSPFAYIGERDRYLAFCDVLHDMLGIDHPRIAPRAMIRLEDVNPDDDPETVQAAIDVFVKEHIPFQIALIPVFVDPNARREIRLSENPGLVKVLHKAVAQGGTIVMHGFTHQYRGVSGDDFEFWDGFQNGPRSDDSTELVHDKLTAGLEELIHNDLYPVSWETPHYAGSQLDYAEFGRIFSTLNEETMIDREGTQQSFPYPTVDVRGLYIVPENVGYLPESNPDPREIIENARAMLVVRDGIASAFVHDFLDPKLLQDVVRGIKGLGYHFVSLRDFDCHVGGGDRLIATAGGARTIQLRDSYLRQFLVARDGSHQQESWSSVRQSGTAAVSLRPGPGEILVALGTDERPVPPPAGLARITRQVVDTFKLLRPQNPLRVGLPPPIKAAVVWQASAVRGEANDQASFMTVFHAYGVPFRRISVSELQSASLSQDEVLVVPHGAAGALTAAEVVQLVQFVRRGGNLVLDGQSALAQAVGVRYPGDSVTIDNVIDRSQVDLPLQWRPPAQMVRFHVPEGGTILAQDLTGQFGVAAAFSSGAGKVVYLGAQLDPLTPFGTSRYPFLFEHVMKTFNRVQPARQRSLELYFDPGLRQNISIEDLAVQWRRLGVRVIYAAAWVFDKRYTYDYDRLVRICHANGILVYAWFELPQVTPAFWADHPEWREMPATGKIYPSWRLAMNLENPACRAAAIAEVMRIVNSWAWDGVTLAELNFDGKANGDQPGSMAPLNDDVRRGFRAQYGFDPAQLFDRASPHWWKSDAAGWQKFLDYRVNVVTGLHRELLTALRPFALAGHEIIVTMLDSLDHPEVTADTGVDSRAIVGLMRDFPFLLQVEDPMVAWTEPPSRYTRLGDHYRAIMPPGGHFMFDINVIATRKVETTHLPLALTAGVELAATVHSARTASDRVALYGDATVRTNDLELLAFAAAEKSLITRHELTWAVDAPQSIELVVPPQLHNFYRDGEDWSYWRPGYVLLPEGRQTISATSSWTHLFDTSALRPQVLQSSTPLLSAGGDRGQLVFEYDAPGPALVCLNRIPAGVVVDGPNAAVVSGARELAAVVLLPAGHHHVQVAGARGFTLFVDVISLISSSLIVVFGTTSIVMLITLFAGIRLRRMFGRGKRTVTRPEREPEKTGKEEGEQEKEEKEEEEEERQAVSRRLALNPVDGIAPAASSEVKS
jgi:uncharacterized protein YdaL